MSKNSQNFGGLETKYTSWDTSHFAVIGVPYDRTVSYRSGASSGPAAILDASQHLESFDEELHRETSVVGIHTLPLLDVATKTPERMNAMVHAACKKILDAGKIPVVLGGEHSIANGSVRAVKERFDKVKILQIDAHCDLRDSFQGSKFSHACIARRFLEMAPVTQVGIRSLSQEEHNFLQTKPKGLKTFFAQEIHTKGISPDEICKDLSGDLYISIDVDGLDPSIMPATGTPEPGGLLWEETLAILRTAIHRCNVVGFDVNELCPIPKNVAPDFLTAKLIYRIMGYVTMSKAME